MKVGSIVQLVDDNWKQPQHSKAIALGITFPVKNKDYTIRTIDGRSGGFWLTLEEIINEERQFNDFYGEPTFSIKKFKELLPPIDINLEEILEELV